MSIALTPAGKAAMLDGVLTAIRGGWIDIYSGVMPAAGASVSDPVQARIPLGQVAGSVTGATLTLLAADGARLAAQQLTWGRLMSATGNVMFDFSVSDSSGAGDMIVSSVSGSVGGIVQLTSAVIGF